MTVKEYNEWIRKYNGAFCFVHAIDQAIYNAGNEARNQMVCRGWSDEMKSTLLEALEALKEKKRLMVDQKDGYEKFNAHETVIGKALDAGHIYR